MVWVDSQSNKETNLVLNRCISFRPTDSKRQTRKQTHRVGCGIIALSKEFSTQLVRLYVEKNGCVHFLLSALTFWTPSAEKNTHKLLRENEAAQFNSTSKLMVNVIFLSADPGDLSIWGFRPRNEIAFHAPTEVLKQTYLVYIIRGIQCYQRGALSWVSVWVCVRRCREQYISNNGLAIENTHPRTVSLRDNLVEQHERREK